MTNTKIKKNKQIHYSSKYIVRVFNDLVKDKPSVHFRNCALEML